MRSTGIVNAAYWERLDILRNRGSGFLSIQLRKLRKLNLNTAICHLDRIEKHLRYAINAASVALCVCGGQGGTIPRIRAYLPGHAMFGPRA